MTQQIIESEPKLNRRCDVREEDVASQLCSQVDREMIAVFHRINADEPVRLATAASPPPLRL